MSDVAEHLGDVVIDPGETWIEFGPPEDRRRIGFHDYAELYRVPGLYAHVFSDRLGMCTAEVLPELFAGAVAAAGPRIDDQRVLDLGAGSGRGGVELRRHGVGHVVGIDLEPAARAAAEREAPGAYADYLVGDLDAFSDGELEALAAHEPTALVLVSAVGAGHVPPSTLDRALGLLSARGFFAFAVTPALLPGSDDPDGQASGYPAYLDELLTRRADELVRHTYVHRRQADGTPHDATALVGRLR